MLTNVIICQQEVGGLQPSCPHCSAALWAAGPHEDCVQPSQSIYDTTAIADVLGCPHNCDNLKDQGAVFFLS